MRALAEHLALKAGERLSAIRSGGSRRRRAGRRLPRPDRVPRPGLELEGPLGRAEPAPVLLPQGCLRLRLERGSEVAAGPDSSEEGLPEVVEVLVGRADDDLAALDVAKARAFPELARAPPARRSACACARREPLRRARRPRPPPPRTPSAWSSRHGSPRPPLQRRRPPSRDARHLRGSSLRIGEEVDDELSEDGVERAVLEGKVLGGSPPHIGSGESLCQAPKRTARKDRPRRRSPRPGSRRAPRSACPCRRRRRVPASPGGHRPAPTARGRAHRRSARRSGRTSRVRRRRSSDPLRLRVDVDAPAAHEAAERHAAVAREIDRERARRADGDDNRAAGNRGLLHELEGETPAHAEHLVRKRKEPLGRTPSRRPCPSRCGGPRPHGRRGARRSNRTARSRAGRPWPRRSAEPPATGRAARPRARPGRRARSRPGALPRRRPRGRPCRRPHRRTRCRSSGSSRSKSTSSFDLHVDHVGGEIGRRVGGHGRDSLGTKESERQLLVVAGGAHGHGDRPAVDPDLERLLDRDLVKLGLPLGKPHDLDGGCGVRGDLVHYDRKP